MDGGVARPTSRRRGRRAGGGRPPRAVGTGSSVLIARRSMRRRRRPRARAARDRRRPARGVERAEDAALRLRVRPQAELAERDGGQRQRQRGPRFGEAGRRRRPSPSAAATTTRRRGHGQDAAEHGDRRRPGEGSGGAEGQRRGPATSRGLALARGRSRRSVPVRGRVRQASLARRIHGIDHVVIVAISGSGRGSPPDRSARGETPGPPRRPNRPHARLPIVSHPSLGLPPLDLTAGFPDAAARMRAQHDRARRARPGRRHGGRPDASRERHDETGLRQLLRDATLLVERIALCVAAATTRPAREYAEWTAPVYRRRRVPMDDLVALCEGLRARCRASWRRPSWPPPIGRARRGDRGLPLAPPDRRRRAQEERLPPVPLQGRLTP